MTFRAIILLVVASLYGAILYRDEIFEYIKKYVFKEKENEDNE